MPVSDEAVLLDPLNYDPFRHGPPYLPARGEAIRPMRTAGLKLAVKAMVEREAASVGEELDQLLAHFVTDYPGEVPTKPLAVLLSALRAEASVHQAHHWMAQGTTFYADHLLFDRVYNESFALVDGLAERTVGSSSPVMVNPVMQMRHIWAFTQSFCKDVSPTQVSGSMPLLSLTVVLRFLVLLNKVYANLEKAGSLSHGTDNMLQGIADGHESFVYLLQQRCSGGGVVTASIGDPAWKTRLPQKERENIKWQQSTRLASVSMSAR